MNTTTTKTSIVQSTVPSSTTKTTKSRAPGIDHTHMAVGGNGVVFLNVLDLRPEELAFLRQRGRRTFQGIEMSGDELASVRAGLASATKPPRARRRRA